MYRTLEQARQVTTDYISLEVLKASQKIAEAKEGSSESELLELVNHMNSWLFFLDKYGEYQQYEVVKNDNDIFEIISFNLKRKD